MTHFTLELRKQNNHSYEIYVGYEILDRFTPLLARHQWGERYVVVTDTHVGSRYGERFLSLLGSSGLPVDMVTFPAGEQSKSMDTLLSLADRLLQKGCDRQTCLLALGGGVVGDVTGFLASIFMRGIPFIQVPTTLLAQVDSSIGGKTGIDIPAGKNILGTFYQPKMVLSDLQFLTTLPDEEFKNGVAEIVKYGAIESYELWTYLETNTKALLARDPQVLAHVVKESCRIKKMIVELDEKDGGVRKILNFGHTIGHAIERERKYTIPHGQAVAIGMAAAARLSELMGYLPSETRQRLDALLDALGLPLCLPPGVLPDGIQEGIKVDKNVQDPSSILSSLKISVFPSSEVMSTKK